MARMLELGHNAPLAPNAKLPDDIVLGLSRENTCPMPGEFNAYAGNHPKEGMPLAVTGLTDQQYQTLQRWLASGAPIDEQGLAPSAKEALQVQQWENLFNQPGARKAWWRAGCSSTCSLLTSTLKAANRGISSSGYARAPRAGSRST